MNIWFASNNLHKKIELEAVFSANGCKIPLKIPAEEGYSFAPDETGTTFCDNALIKARELKKILKNNPLNKDIVISDDSGLCIDALNGRPGVISAIYGEENGKKLSSEEKYLLVLDELGDNPIRTARFICTMVLLLENDRFFVVQETVEGQIVKKNEIKGDGGFGYDPIFFIPELNRTFAEISTEEKNILSHRGKAGKAILNILKLLS